MILQIGLLSAICLHSAIHWRSQDFPKEGLQTPTNPNFGKNPDKQKRSSAFINYYTLIFEIYSDRNKNIWLPSERVNPQNSSSLHCKQPMGGLTLKTPLATPLKVYSFVLSASVDAANPNHRQNPTQCTPRYYIFTIITSRMGTLQSHTWLHIRRIKLTGILKSSPKP